ncbi:MAG: AhpC/TSA family protein [Bacteroidales bacterium]|nr:AhpC/TSA family protein [Bacteroidales bacterium]
MRSFSSIILTVAAAAVLSSCGGRTSISGSIKDCGDVPVTVRLLDVNKYKTLDTLKVKKDGSFSYKMDVAEGQPEFVYLFRGDANVAAVILNAGDKVKISADTLGNYSVEGSKESEMLLQANKDFQDFMSRFSSTASSLTVDNAKEVRADLSRQYVDYYRRCVKYVLSNSKSLSVIPVFYQKINDNFPVFGQASDGMLFNAIADSLSTVYPDSRYVAALRKEAGNRKNTLEMNERLRLAGSLSYPDIELPGLDGKKVKLSSLEGKVVLVNFWTAPADGAKLYNMDVLKPVYDRFKGKGLAIYSVNIDTDKALWANIVKNQGLEWTSVCDGLGTASPVITMYNVKNLPYNCFIVNGEMSDSHALTLPEITAFLNKTLR